MENSDSELLGKWYNSFAILVNTVPFLITIFIPNVATVLGFIGSIFGFFIIYLYPVMTYLKMLKNEISEEKGLEIQGNEDEF